MLATLLGINRKRIYTPRIQGPKDELVRQSIAKVHKTDPSYGHKRLAIDLQMGRNRILRIMRKFGIKPPRRKVHRHWLTESTSDHHYTNLIKGLITDRPGQVFATDLTYLKHQGKQFYLATVEDLFTREIMAAQVSDKHDSVLALSAIHEAVSKQIPQIFHSDQGKEFMAQIVTQYLENQDVRISVSDKGSPWQNGYKESFFGRFKDENGDLNRFDSLGELVAEIYAYLYYYNNLRIHTSLKMPPARFKQNYIDSLSRKSGT